MYELYNFKFIFTMTTSKYVKWRKKLKFQISLIFHKKDYLFNVKFGAK